MFLPALEGDGGAKLEQALLPYARVGDGYFATAGIEILQGRALTRDDHGTRNVVVGEPMARQLFGEVSAVGRRVRTADDGDWWNIVGVAENTSAFTLASAEDDLQLYWPLLSATSPNAYSAVVVRATDDPRALEAGLRQVLRDLDPEQPVRQLTIAADTVQGWIVEPRFYLLLLGVFAAAALLLVLVGIGGVVGHSVASRTREIGIRVALGASDRSIIGMAVAGAFRPAIVGLAVGAIVALQITKLMDSLLYEIQPTDPTSLASVAVLFIVATLVASYLPARRVLQVDPVRALRAE